MEELVLLPDVIFPRPVHNVPVHISLSSLLFTKADWFAFMIDAQELARLVAEFGKIYTRRVWSEIGKAGTTPARARLLAALQCQGSRMMSELGAELGVTPRSVTKLVDSLEAEGLVARQRTPPTAGQLL